MQNVDYLIKNGHIIDPYQGKDYIGDLAISQGKIVDCDHVKANHVVDADGCLVTPGFIDFHTHVACGVTELGIPTDVSYLPTGVTTVVDAGSCGASNFDAFHTLMSTWKTRTKAFLYVGSGGLVTTAYPDNIDPSKYQENKILQKLEQYPDILGLKIRQGAENAGEMGLEPLRRTIEIAEKAHCPVAVHISNSPRPVVEIARMLRPGDIFIHVYEGKGDTYIRSKEEVAELREIQKKGVIFDCSNGNSHFCLEVAQFCLGEGLYPDIISTDNDIKSQYVPGKGFSLPFVMSKYITLGMDIKDIIRCVTTTPARLIGEEKNLGSLCVGTCADIAISRIVKHPVEYLDFRNTPLQGDTLIKTEMTFREGVPLYRQIEFI